jgi:hypothetical protein
LIVTGAGVIIGVLAIFGYQTFREEVRQRAAKAAQEAAEEYFKGKAFEDKLVSRIAGPTWQGGTVPGTVIEPEAPGTIAATYPR